MKNDATRVCIVGTARQTWREAETIREPLDMWEHVARAAIDDVNTRADVAAELDELSIVHCQSWDYDNPVARLGARFGRTDIRGNISLLAGTSPQRMLDEAASAMVRGEISTALIVGAEAQATLRRFAAEGTQPAWSFPNPAPERVQDMLAEWYLPTELRHGILPAWLTFALLGQARWAARGGTAADRDAMFTRLSRCSEVAAASPHAWFPTAHSAERLASIRDRNRPIATPFTKLATAFPHVDMAAANLLVTEETADRWGVPEDRRVYLRGWGFARDASHIGARVDLTTSPAMRAATNAALEMAGLERDDLDAFDFYSCFGTAIDFACDANEIGLDDPRPISLTGALPFHGGPGSNYMSHSISAVVEGIRAGSFSSAMVTGVGMHMTKHVAGVWSGDRGDRGPSSDSDPQRAVLDDVESPMIRDEVDGTAQVDTASALHDRDGTAASVVAICTLPDNTRCYAISTDSDVIDAVLSGEWVGATATLRPDGKGRNLIHL